MCYIMTATGLTLLTSKEAKEFYGLNKTPNKTNISMNIAEDYCSFELSKLLKEKGFDGDCDCFFIRNGGEPEQLSLDELNYHKEDYIKAPTHQMAMKWLREKGIYVYVEPYMVGGTYIEELKVHYCGRILDTNKRQLHSIENMTSYTEAIEERIKYALKSLI